MGTGRQGRDAPRPRGIGPRGRSVPRLLDQRLDVPGESADEDGQGLGAGGFARPRGATHLSGRPVVRGGRAGAGDSEPALGGCARRPRPVVATVAAKRDGRSPAHGRPRASAPRTGSRRSEGTLRPGPVPSTAVHSRRMRAQEPTPGGAPCPCPSAEATSLAARQPTRRGPALEESRKPARTLAASGTLAVERETPWNACSVFISRSSPKASISRPQRTCRAWWPKAERSPRPSRSPGTWQEDPRGSRGAQRGSSSPPDGFDYPLIVSA